MPGTPFDSDLLPKSANDALMCAIRDALKEHPWVREQFQDRVYVSQVAIQDPLDLEYNGSAVIVAEEQWAPEGWSAASIYPSTILTIAVLWPAAMSGYLEGSGQTRTANSWLLLLFKVLSTNEAIQAARGGIPPKLLSHTTTRRQVQSGVQISTAARVLTGNPRTSLVG